MTRIDTLGPWLAKSPITGRRAIFWAIVAVAVPTLLRASLNGIVTGLAVTPYVPFVLLSAVFLEWRYAAFVALAAGLIADAIFIGPPNQFFEGPTDIIALGFLFLASAMIIMLVQLVRSELSERRQAARSSEAPSGIVFSLEDGQAWAGWYGEDSRVQLGPQHQVAEMMEDFLAQLELVKRLNHEDLIRESRSDTSPSAAPASGFQPPSAGRVAP